MLNEQSKAYIIFNKHTKKVEESLNVTFDETPPFSKKSPLVDDNLDEKEAIKVVEKKNLENDIVDETLEIDEIVNIKESRNHPLENVIGNLNQRTLRPQAQNQSNFFCFISTIEPNNVNESLGDESWIVAMQEELNQFIDDDIWKLVPQPKNMTIIETKWVFRNKLDENGIVSRNKARLVAQGCNQQEGIDYDETYAPVARLESIRILLAYVCALDFKLFQVDVKSAFLDGFINEEVYVVKPSGFIDFEKPDHVYKLKKALYGLKQAPKAWTGIETVVYADSDHAGEYVDRKSTSSICTFVGCCLTSWFSKKQTTLAISTIEAGYVIAGKACQQTLWMKQALINYDIQLDDVPIMCDNKGPYQSNLPSPDDIISYIREDREGQVTRIRHQEEIDVQEYQVLTREIEPTLKPLEEIIQENVFCLGARLILPYGMLLTRLFDFIIGENPELQNESYVLYDRVMNPLAAQLEKKPRRDRGTTRDRHSTSSFTFNQPYSSHLNDDDDDDGNNERTSRANTPSLIRYVNSLTNEVPQVFQNPPNIDPHLEPFYTRQIGIINSQVQIRDEHRGGLRSIGKGFRNLWRNLKKK
nr:retrovirus-related Pol polyprotein from transposon TNT 1-94 [Tanacetum cinerariifolium]